MPFLSLARLRLSLILATASLLVLFKLLPWLDRDILLSYDNDLTTPVGAFSFVYKSEIWGEATRETPFNSGPGSHDREVVEPYVAATRLFISRAFADPPDLVDLGCGDFNVGRQLRNITSRYTACDVVPGVIAHNRQAYSEEKVDFRVLDIVSEELPDGDVVIVRQVLQHLRNEQIARFLPKIGQYKWAIVTEHLPLDVDFTPNVDIELVGSVRTLVDSGVELTASPFNLKSYNATIISESLAYDGRIRTTAYQMQSGEL